MLSKGAVTMCERRRACKILRPGASCLASSIYLPPITPACKHLLSSPGTYVLPLVNASPRQCMWPHAQDAFMNSACV